MNDRKNAIKSNYSMLRWTSLKFLALYNTDSLDFQLNDSCLWMLPFHTLTREELDEITGFIHEWTQLCSYHVLHIHRQSGKHVLH